VTGGKGCRTLSILPQLLFLYENDLRRFYARIFVLSSARRGWHENRIRDFLAVSPVIEDHMMFFNQSAQENIILMKREYQIVILF
jgi:hypothetical protein